MKCELCDKSVSETTMRPVQRDGWYGTLDGGNVQAVWVSGRLQERKALCVEHAMCAYALDLAVTVYGEGTTRESGRRQVREEGRGLCGLDMVIDHYEARLFGGPK